MQGTRAIAFEKCGRRFSLDSFRGVDTVSGRGQNWLDVDGSASGRGVPTLMVSGAESAKKWWMVDDKVGYDAQGPLRFIDSQPWAGAPKRGLGHFRMEWDDALHNQVGPTFCGNVNSAPCPVLGYIRHAGKRFSGTATAGPGLAITARGDIVGPVGGYGWIVQLQKGAPRTVHFYQMEVLPETAMLVSIAYPAGTTFTIGAHGPEWCWTGSTEFSCSSVYTKVASVAEVRNGAGNQYFVDSNGVLTMRIVQLPYRDYVGRPDWFLPNLTDKGQFGGWAYGRFERSGVLLPKSAYHSYIVLKAQCGGSGPYCSGTTVNYDPQVCPSGFPYQRAYDYCCSSPSSTSSCVFAGSA